MPAPLSDDGVRNVTNRVFFYARPQLSAWLDALWENCCHYAAVEASKYITCTSCVQEASVSQKKSTKHLGEAITRRIFTEEYRSIEKLPVGNGLERVLGSIRPGLTKKTMGKRDGTPNTLDAHGGPDPKVPDTTSTRN